MVRGSIPLGRFLGVDVRLHWSFPLLFVLALAWGRSTTGYAMRGFGVFAALLLAVLIRELARVLAATYAGLRARVIFLLPIGGVMGFAPDPTGRAMTSRALLLAAPAANVLAGLVLLGISYAGAPGVDLLRQPWISCEHVLRTFVWMQFILAAVNLLPAAALPTRQLMRLNAGEPPQTTEETKPAASPSPVASAAAFSLLSGLAMAMMLAGIFTANLWLLMLGGFTLLGSHLRAQASPAGNATAAGEAILVEEVMSTDYLVLSSSDTLGGALERIATTTQEVFPVVRGDRMVGAVSRQTLTGNLQSAGDSYVQGVMTKTLDPARREEPLGTALGRATSAGSSECVPVIDGFDGPAGGRILGILTPQTVGRAVQQVKQARQRDESRQQRS